MSRNQVSQDKAILKQLLARIEKGRLSGLKGAAQSGIAALNVDTISDGHRAALTGVLRCLLNEDVARAILAADPQNDAKEDQSRLDEFKISFHILTARAIARSEAAGKLSDAQAALENAKQIVKSITAGISDANVRESIEGIVDTYTADDIDAIRWRIVLLSLLAFQASEAKLRCEANDRSTAFDELRNRIEELKRLVANLFPKPKEEHQPGGLHDGLAGLSSGPSDPKKTLGFGVRRP